MHLSCVSFLSTYVSSAVKDIGVDCHVHGVTKIAQAFLSSVGSGRCIGRKALRTSSLTLRDLDLFLHHHHHHDYSLEF
jgi:hypothetical protein